MLISSRTFDMTVFLSTRLHLRQQIGLSPKTHRRRLVPPPVGSGRRAGLERAAWRSGPAELVVRDEAGRPLSIAVIASLGRSVPEPDGCSRPALGPHRRSCAEDLGLAPTFSNQLSTIGVL